MDDAFQQITHVTRGEDLLASTHVHRILQFLLEMPGPVYLHHPLVLDNQGRRLAKRHDALSIATLREAGLSAAEALALIDFEFNETWLPHSHGRMPQVPSLGIEGDMGGGETPNAEILKRKTLRRGLGFGGLGRFRS